ncbi:putative noozle protein [Paracoccus phage vB_PmaP_KLEP18-1]|nr:putative noozle protein [Paracoccus phage vB_PmaP_KLEP18-1]
MPTIDIPLGEFLPSQPTAKNPGCVIADNVIPAEGGYAPLPAPIARPETVPGRVHGAELMFRPEGVPFIVGGTSGRLFVRVGNTVTSQVSTPALDVGLSWDFAQFNNFIIATAPGNIPRYIPDYTAGVSFIALPGSPPIARYCERFAEFVMLGNIDGAESRVQWSSYNSPAGSWAPARITQAGFNDLNPRFGAVTALVGGCYPMVFQDRAVWLVQYVGPPSVWQFTLASEDRGCIAPFSAVTVGSQTFFLSQDGFWLTNGSEFVPIGSQRVNRWFFETADNATLNRTQGTVDWRNKCIVWAFRSAQAPGEDFDRVLIYSWEQDRFSTATINVQRLVGSRIPGTTLEDLDALFGSLENVTPNLDAAEWRAGDRILAAFIGQSGQAAYSTFNGPALEANWETGFFQPMPGSRAFVSEAQAVMDAQDWVMQVAPVQMDNQRTETYGPFTGPGVNGASPMRGDGKEMRLAVRMPDGATWERVIGVQLTFRPSGRR